MTSGAESLAALAPVAFGVGGACVVLIAEMMLGARWGGERPLLADSRLGVVLAAIATFSLGTSIWYAISIFGGAEALVFPPDHPMLRMDRFSCMAIGVIGLGGVLAAWLSITYLQALHLNYGGYYALLLVATSGLFVIVCSVHLVPFFLGSEIAGLSLCVLVGFDRRRLRGGEAALKYFLMGGVASATALYGIALLYGATGEMAFAGIGTELQPSNALGVAGLALLLVGFGFKIAVPPFHQWAPDVYEGAPAPVTAFVSVAVMAAGFLALMRILSLAVPDFALQLAPVLRTAAVLAIVVGNLMAIIQTNVKRLLAYSGIAHAGYLAIALAAGTPDAYSAAFFYLFVFVFLNLGAFAVVVILAQGGHENEVIDDYSGLAPSRPGLAAACALFMLALAGLPGTAGFTAKFAVFSAAIGAGEMGLVIVGLLGSALSILCYLRVPLAMYMNESRGKVLPDLASNEFVVLVLCAAATLYYGFFFDLALFDEAVRALH